MSRDSQCITWDLTIPRDQATIREVKELFREHCKAWVFQLEEGETSEYVHYQCRIKLKEKLRQNQVVNIFKEYKAHVSRTSTNGSKDDFYVMKTRTRVKGPWSDKDPVIPIQYQGTPRKWRPFQEMIIKVMITKPDPRKIYIILDRIGGTGKSYLCHWLACRGQARIIPPFNELKDIMGMACDTSSSNTYFIDVPRAMEKKKFREFYAGLEMLKAGYCYDPRYHFKEKYLNTPHIFVFTNEVPNLELLSIDRWVIIDLQAEWNVDDWKIKNEDFENSEEDED